LRPPQFPCLHLVLCLASLCHPAPLTRTRSANPPTLITELLRAAGVFAGIGLYGGIIQLQAVAASEEIRLPRPKTAVVSVAEVEVCATFLAFLDAVIFAPGTGVGTGVIRSVPGHFLCDGAV
jgi:hypothetical protein